MELNREQIIKALECCSINQSCDGCPMFDKEPIADCTNYVISCALSLIKELTEEDERLREELAKSCKALDESMNFYCSFTQSKVSNCPIDDEVVKAKADTVRKMHSEIKERCIKGGIYPAFVARTIDQIAKEMTESEDTECQTE